MTLFLRPSASNNTAIQSLAEKEGLLDDRPETKVVGVLWNTKTYMLKYPQRTTASTIPNPITKREVLQDDPLGFLGPVTVRAKSLMKELWRQGIERDEPLAPDLQMKWTDFAKKVGDYHLYRDTTLLCRECSGKDFSRLRIQLHWSLLLVKFAVSFLMVSPTWSALTTVKPVCWFSSVIDLSTCCHGQIYLIHSWGPNRAYRSGPGRT